MLDTVGPFSLVESAVPIVSALPCVLLFALSVVRAMGSQIRSLSASTCCFQRHQLSSLPTSTRLLFLTAASTPTSETTPMSDSSNPQLNVTVRKYCTECTVTVITCLVVAKELFILCALFIPSSHHSSFSVSFMPCSYL